MSANGYVAPAPAVAHDDTHQRAPAHEAPGDEPASPHTATPNPSAKRPAFAAPRLRASPPIPSHKVTYRRTYIHCPHFARAVGRATGARPRLLHGAEAVRRAIGARPRLLIFLSQTPPTVTRATGARTRSILSSSPLNPRCPNTFPELLVARPPSANAESSSALSKSKRPRRSISSRRKSLSIQRSQNGGTKFTLSPSSSSASRAPTSAQTRSATLQRYSTLSPIALEAGRSGSRREGM